MSTYERQYQTGSLVGIAPVTTAHFDDDEWFEVRVRQDGKNVQVFLRREGGSEWKRVVDWTQPEDWIPPKGLPNARLDHGTVAFSNWTPEDGETWIKKILFRELKPAASAPLASSPSADLGWQPLFSNDSLEGWKDLSGGYTLSNGVLTCTETGRNLISPKEYGNFHLKFDLKLSPEANNGIGIWYQLRPDGTAVESDSGFEVQLFDDSDPKYARMPTWQKHGGIYYFKEASAFPMQGPGTWNAHEIRVEGTKVTVIINNVTVLETDLTTLSPLVDRRRPLRLDRKRGHLVFMGNKNSVEFRNLMIKDLDAPAASSPASQPVTTPTLWTDVQGRTIQAKFLRIEGENALLEVNGTLTPVPMARLSPESRQVAIQLHGTQPPASSRSDWFVGSWRLANSERSSSEVMILQADQTAHCIIGTTRLKGQWSLAGPSMNITWENGVRYEMDIPDAVAPKVITGKRTAPDGRLFTIKLEKDDAMGQPNNSSSTAASTGGWTPLFPNSSLDGWVGDTRGYSVNNDILTSTANGRDLISLKEYGNFHLKFDLRLSPGANSGIGVWCDSTPGEYRYLAQTGFEIQILDDYSPIYSKSHPWQIHGSIYDFLAPKARPMQLAGTWNTHELKVEGTRVTLTINGVTVLDGELPRGMPKRESSRRHKLNLSKKRGHLVICGMRGPVEFRNMQIKELP